MDRLTYQIIDLGYAVDAEEIETFPMDTFNVHHGNAIDKLAEYENAEEQGLLLRLPCKVGDIVYQIDRTYKKVILQKVSSINVYIGKKSSSIQITFENAGMCFHREFGKSVFFNKADARKALNEYLGREST